MQFKRVVAVYNERIAAALEGIQHELKRLNDSNPSNRAQAKQKEPEKKEFKPKNFIQRVLAEMAIEVYELKTVSSYPGYETVKSYRLSEGSREHLDLLSRNKRDIPVIQKTNVTTDEYGFSYLK